MTASERTRGDLAATQAAQGNRLKLEFTRNRPEARPVLNMPSALSDGAAGPLPSGQAIFGMNCAASRMRF